MNRVIYIILILIYSSCIFGQSFEGIWEYEVLNTLSGDYFGKLIIEEENNRYSGKFLSRGEEYYANFKYIKDDSISIQSNLENFIVNIRGRISENKIKARVFVVGDSNIYRFDAKRKSKEQIIKVIDSNTKEIISYANVVLPNNKGTITNEEGLCKIKIQGKQSKIMISAIGYETDTFEIRKVNDFKVIEIIPNSYSLPEIEVRGKGFSAKSIVKAAISRLNTNYIQTPYNANLFFRYSSLNNLDSLLYQSESILKYYDSKGYQKRGWRKASSSRFARLEEGRININRHKKEKKNTLNELNQIFIFWSHEPIVTIDKPLSEKSINAYEYNLITVNKFKSEEIYEIEFNCTKLKSRFAGLPSLKYFRGKLFINKNDYAIVRYEHEYLMDYQHKGKHTEKRGNLNERQIIKSRRIELFSKTQNSYYLEYGKEVNQNESQNLLINGKTKITKGKSISEFQYFDIRTTDIEILKENLFKIDKEFNYDKSYWDKFNLILNIK